MPVCYCFDFATDSVYTDYETVAMARSSAEQNREVEYKDTGSSS